MLKFLVVD